MPKYRDKYSLGRSNICPYKPGENGGERHRRRLITNLLAADALEQLFTDNHLSFEIHNNGHHWQVFQGNEIVEWWPSSAKLVFNKHWNKAAHCHDYEQFLKQIANFFRFSLPDNIFAKDNLSTIANTKRERITLTDNNRTDGQRGQNFRY